MEEEEKRLRHFKNPKSTIVNHQSLPLPFFKKSILLSGQICLIS